MCSNLRKLFCCCIPDNRQAPYMVNSFTSITEDLEETIHFKIPRGEFGVYFEKDLHSWELDISGFMYLYKYATDERVRKPGPDYKYSRFVFRADGEYIKLEGWTPVDIFNVKPGMVGILSKPSVECKPSSRNIVSVDLNGIIIEETKAVAMQEVSSFKINAPSPKAPARSGISTYSRHMAEF